MSRPYPPTDEELRWAFEKLLASGGDDGMPSCTGLDIETRAAIARAWEGAVVDEKQSSTLRAAARQEFALQLDGTHAREAEARSIAYFMQQIA